MQFMGIDVGSSGCKVSVVDKMEELSVFRQENIALYIKIFIQHLTRMWFWRVFILQ